MTLDEFRREMESYRRDVDEEARALKDSYLALERLHSLYRKFDDLERGMADQILAEWALSKDESMRFDALALIDEFKVATAIPALQKLSDRLARDRAPGAPFQRNRVTQILDGLSRRE